MNRRVPANMKVKTKEVENNMSKSLRILMIAAAPALAGMTMAASAQSNVVNPDAGFANVERSYTELDQRYARDGRLRSADNVMQIRPGATQAQVLNLLGQPISRNAAGVWDYNIKLRLVQKHTMVCQYKVHFGQDKKVQKTTWRRPQCAELVSQ